MIGSGKLTGDFGGYLSSDVYISRKKILGCRTETTRSRVRGTLLCIKPRCAQATKISLEASRYHSSLHQRPRAIAPVIQASNYTMMSIVDIPDHLKRQRAIVQSQSLPGKMVVISDRLVPNPNSDEVLVQVHAVAVNPSDWKMTTQFPFPGAGCGMDFSGVVVAAGPGLDPKIGIAVGDVVAGAVHGANPMDPQAGSFAEYTTAFADLLWKPPRSWPFTDSAAIGGCCVGTVGLALFAGDALGLKFEINQSFENSKRPFVLVYGGSTASGTMAIQLARMYAAGPFHQLHDCQLTFVHLAAATA